MVAHGATHQHKRHGKHQKRTKPFMKVYWPYVPLLAIFGMGLVFSALWHPRTQRNVLPYATSMSSNALFSSTNQQRTTNGKSSLKLNSLLSQAAQAKANDMAKHDYWSHNTPDGKAPWVFIDQAGYSYKSAGENLAYGFANSADTVAGWMNSPAHKANLLSSNYADVGFGFVNSANYQNDGPQTIVVAMYGAPLANANLAASPATSPPSATPSSQSNTVAAKDVTKSQSNKETAQANSAPTNAATLSDQQQKNIPVREPSAHSVSRLAVLTNGNLAWLASALTGIVLVSSVMLALRHSIALHKWLRRGERYVLHHTVFDITVVSLVGLCLIAGQSAGLIK